MLTKEHIDMSKIDKVEQCLAFLSVKKNNNKNKKWLGGAEKMVTGRESENEEKMENYSKGSLLKLNFTPRQT